MRLASALIAVSSVLSQETCPDSELGEVCSSRCAQRLIDCIIQCSDDSCRQECNRAEIECTNSCPCYSQCPDGCKLCFNPICSEDIGIFGKRTSQFSGLYKHAAVASDVGACSSIARDILIQGRDRFRLVHLNLTLDSRW